MKIIHCIFSLNTGGAENMLVDILNEQVKLHHVTLIIINKSYTKELIKKISEKVKLFFLDRCPGSRSIFPLIKLNYLLYSLRPDILHIHSLQLVKTIFIHRKSLFYTAHCMELDEKYLKHLKNIFAISQAVKDDILQKGKHVVQVIENGIHFENIKQKISVQPTRNFRIIQVGRLNHQLKGQDILIKAAAQLIHRNLIPRLSVDFIGEGPSLSYLKELCAQEGISEQVHFLGLQNREYIYSHLCDYDLMCHPSRSEGFGLTVAEGIAARIPVLVATGDGPFEIIGKGKFGYYFERENIEECASQIVHIYKNYGDCYKITDIAWPHIVQNYSINRMVGQYLDAYINKS